MDGRASFAIAQGNGKDFTYSLSGGNGLGRTIINGIGPRYVTSAGSRTFIDIAQGEGAANSTTNLDCRYRMGIGEINIIEGNRASIAQGGCCILSNCTRNVGDSRYGGNRGGVVRAGDGDRNILR